MLSYRGDHRLEPSQCVFQKCYVQLRFELGNLGSSFHMKIQYLLSAWSHSQTALSAMCESSHALHEIRFALPLMCLEQIQNRPSPEHLGSCYLALNPSLLRRFWHKFIVRAKRLTEARKRRSWYPRRLRECAVHPVASMQYRGRHRNRPRIRHAASSTIQGASTTASLVAFSNCAANRATRRASNPAT